MCVCWVVCVCLCNVFSSDRDSVYVSLKDQLNSRLNDVDDFRDDNRCVHFYLHFFFVCLYFTYMYTEKIIVNFFQFDYRISIVFSFFFWFLTNIETVLIFYRTKSAKWFGLLQYLVWNRTSQNEFPLCDMCEWVNELVCVIASAALTYCIIWYVWE